MRPATEQSKPSAVVSAGNTWPSEELWYRRSPEADRHHFFSFLLWVASPMKARGTSQPNSNQGVLAKTRTRFFLKALIFQSNCTGINYFSVVSVVHTVL